MTKELTCENSMQKKTIKETISAKETYIFFDPTDRSHPIPAAALLRTKMQRELAKANRLSTLVARGPKPEP